ncbi:hypothetical protein FRC17_004332 [Serendipita sp. 399]|nr:hypothetical protein FRC17_004332 [Serendipita sp. 399]
MHEIAVNIWEDIHRLISRIDITHRKCVCTAPRPPSSRLQPPFNTPEPAMDAGMNAGEEVGETVNRMDIDGPQALNIQLDAPESEKQRDQTTQDEFEDTIAIDSNNLLIPLSSTKVTLETEPSHIRVAAPSKEVHRQEKKKTHNELASFRQLASRDEPCATLDNGEYFHNDPVSVMEDPTIAGTHTRSHSLSSFDDAASNTETNTVRGSLVHGDFLDGHGGHEAEEDPDPDQTITGLGLTNLQETNPLFIQNSVATPFQSDSTAIRDAVALYLSPTVSSMTLDRASWNNRTQPIVGVAPLSAGSYGQELIVKPHDQQRPNSINLTAPHASSLLINRSRKNTVTEEPQPSAYTSILLTPEARDDLTGFRETQPSQTQITSPTIPAPETSPSSLVESPIDYENEPPSRAKLRFQRAYQLVTKELRQRVAHLRRSPITPGAPQTQDTIQPTEILSQSPIIPSHNTSPDTHQVSLEEAEGPSVLDQYLGNDDYTAEDAFKQAETRPWLKPLRLSTYGSQGFFPVGQPSAISSIPMSRGVGQSERSLTRPSSPEKQPSVGTSSRQNSQMGKNDADIQVSALSKVESSFSGWSGFGPIPLSMTPSRPASSSRNSAGSASPTRISRVHSAASFEAKRPLSARSHSAFSHQTAPTPPLPTHKPELFFAIASSKPDQVARLLATGTSPNETVGPHDMPALAFAINNMTEGNLENRPQQEEIVATLLSYGADPNGLDNISTERGAQVPNPLVQYFLDKAQRSPVPPSMPSHDDENETALKRAKYTVVGQEHGIDEFAKAYSAHSRLAKYLDEEEDDNELPFVAIFTGPSGHGKTLLASRVGRLLGLPSYTINMTLLKSQVDIWSTVSCNEREAQMFPTLRHFLTAHDNQRSVVVIDEVEKLGDRSLLQTFLVPWEAGRVQDNGVINTARTIWICTSNIGSDEVIRLAEQRPHTSNEYVQIVREARSCLRDTLGSSLIARVSTIVAFLPFTVEERIAIASKSLSALQRKMALSRPATSNKLTGLDWSGVAEKAAMDYLEAEGARSIRRTIIRLADDVTRFI